MSTSTINYELALALKNAGFPQKENYNALYPHGYCFNGTTKGIKQSKIDRAYPPTLSELIEACGDTLRTIHNYKGSWGCNEDEYGMAETVGSTPEEAVALLWLALQMK